VGIPDEQTAVVFELEFEQSRLLGLKLELEQGKYGMEYLAVQELGYPSAGEQWCEGMRDDRYLECSPAGSGAPNGIRYILRSWSVGGGRVTLITTSGPYVMTILPTMVADKASK